MLKDFQKAMRKKKVKSVLLLNSSLHKMDPNFAYFSGMWMEFGFVVVPVEGKPVLIVPLFEYERAKKESLIRTVALEKGKLDLLLGRLLRGRNVGVNMSHISINEIKWLRKLVTGKQYIDVSKELIVARSVKSSKEIAIVKKSCGICQRILVKCFKQFRRFKTELDVAKFLENETFAAGCELAFPPIVASGSNAGMAHHMPQNVQLKKGFCVIDFGVKYQGYCSDITRTVFIGKPTEKEKGVYNDVLDVQKTCVKMCVGGQKCSVVYDYALEMLGEWFTHGLGHGIGVEIHEWPNLKPKGKEKFEDGMIFTVEPGVYTKKYGIRIEDDVLIENGKPKVLTPISKAFRIVK